MHCPKQQNESGQALIVILLVSAIGLTLGLTLASRSTEETAVTTELEESSRAFSAAEAGLEESIQNIGRGPTPIQGALSSGAKYDVAVQIAGGKPGPFQFPGEVKNNQPVTVWLVEHKQSDGLPDWNNIENKNYDGSSINICWGESGGGEVALETTLYYRSSGGEYYIAREVFNDAVVSGATSVNPAAAGDCGGNYKYLATVNFSSMQSKFPYTPGDTLLYMKIRPLFPGAGGKTKIAVQPPPDIKLPTQGEIHAAVGTTDTGYKTKITQFISHPGPPELFDTVIFSKTKLEKAVP